MMCGKVRLSRLLVPAAIVAVGLAANAGAIPVTVDGSLAEWGITVPGAIDSPAPAWIAGIASGVNYFLEDNALPDGFVGPGFGGQDFDMEIIASTIYETAPGSGVFVLAAAMVTGTDPRGEFANGQWWYWGDLFIDFGDNGSYDQAIQLTSNTNTASPFAPADGGGVNTFNAAVWDVSGGRWLNPSPYPVATPWSINYGTATNTGQTASVAWTDAVADGGTSNDVASDHNILELTLVLTADQLAAIGGPAGGLRLHWTQQCGNDIGETTPPIPPNVPEIPEPSTLALLGIGVVAGVVRRRFVRK